MKKIILFSLLLLLYPYISLAADLGEIYNVIKTAGQAAALLAMIWGGVRYLLSIGNPGLAAEARAWLIAGFTGLLIVTSADFIYKVVTGRAISWKIEEKIPEVRPEMVEKLSGVYLYSREGCPEKAKGVPDYDFFLGLSLTSRRATFQKVKSVKIENNEAMGFKWKVLAFSDEDFKGKLTVETDKVGCTSFEDSFSIVILNVAITPEEAGEEVRFFEGPGRQGGRVVIEKPGERIVNLAEEKINYKKIEVSPERRAECPHLYQPPKTIEGNTTIVPRCLQSIEAGEKYVVLLMNEGAGAYQLFMDCWGAHPCEVTASSPWVEVAPNMAKIIPYLTK